MKSEGRKERERKRGKGKGERKTNWVRGEERVRGECGQNTYEAPKELQK